MANEFVAKNGLISLKNSQVTGSLTVTNGVTASLFGSASYASSGLSASFATSASYAPNLFALTTGSTYPITASWAINATTASNASIAVVALTAGVAGTASFVTASNVQGTVLSASNSISASQAQYAKTSFVEDINNSLVIYLPINEGTGSAIKNYSSYGVDAVKKEFNSGSVFTTGSGWSTNSKRGGYSQLLTVSGIGLGSASYIEMNNATIADGLANMTFAIWYQSSGSTTNSGRIVTKFNGGTTGAFSYELFDNNTISVILVNAGLGRVDLTVTTPKLNDNRWHHIVGVYDQSASFASVYVDGKFCGGIVQSGSLNPTTSPLRIGTFENLGLAPTIGYIDEFKLWGRALNANEIRYLYNDGNLENDIYTDAIGNNTVSGSTTFLAGATGSLQGTSSWANSATSASYAVSASFAPNQFSLVTASTYPITASWSINALTASSLVTTNNYLVNNLSASNVSASTVNFSGISVNTLGQLSVQNAGVFDNNIFYCATFGNAINIKGASAGFQIADRANSAHAWQHYADRDFFRIWNTTTNEFFVMAYATGKVGLNLPSSSVVNQLDVGGNISCSVITASLFKGTASVAIAATQIQAISGSSIVYDAPTNTFISNVALDLSTAGIYDGANGVPAIQVNDSGHLLFDINGIAALDFTNPKQLLGSWSGSITNALTASSINFVPNTAKSASVASSSISSSYSVNASSASSARTLYDKINGVLAVDVQDQRILYDINGNQKLIFSSPGQLLGQWLGYVANATSSLSSSLANTASALVGWNFNNTSSTLQSLNTQSVVFSIQTGSYTAAFFDYTAISASNVRAGVIFGSWVNGSISYTEVRNADIGNTSQVTMSLGLSGSTLQVSSSVSTTTRWTIKILGRYI